MSDQHLRRKSGARKGVSYLKKAAAVLLTGLLFAGTACSASPELVYYTPTEPETEEAIFYRPETGALADVIPYYEDGKYYLYYLHDYRNVATYGAGVDWDLLVTEDFVSYENLGTVIRRGSPSQQDNNVFTGGIIKDKEGLYHIFYTGNNASYLGTGKPKEAIMHAVSEDMVRWRKIPEDTFYAPSQYMSDDWRDPYVYYDEAEGDYKMLLAARLTEGAESARGVTAMLASDDLKTWNLRDPLYAPAKYHTHECPDLFRMGDWWYLVFSEFSDRISTRYVMSRDLENWIEPAADMFDGRAFYAAKTAGDGEKRYIFGWVPTKTNNEDIGGWEWGGSLAVHEIYQKEDGTLGVRAPQSQEAVFSEEIASDSIGVRGTSGRTEEIGSLPQTYMLRCTVSGEFVRAGYSVGHSAADGYRYVIDPAAGAFSFENYPSANLFSDVTVPIPKADTYELTIFVEGQVCTAYVNGEKALSTRVDGTLGAAVGFYVQGGEATFDYTISVMRS